MANKDDYLTSYREFFEYFAKTVNPNDQLPVKLGSYKLLNVEVIGGIIDWTTQYLSQKNCPPHLFAPLIKIIIEEIRKGCKKEPVNYGFSSADNAYEPLKLMQAVMAKTNDVCLRYLDNNMLCSLPAPSNAHYTTSISSMRNKRKRMEDRHIVIHDINTMFNIQEASPSSYYAIFDGHAGHDAAAYSAAHLHQFLAENRYFVSNPELALLDAFCKTDALFLEKCKIENLNGGTTAVVALLRPKENSLYIAWVGDSQALLVNQGKVLQCVNPHKPCREDERERIEKAGGCVMLWGTWRVNGQLAVSRAIGDVDYKPHVIAIPDVREISLDGGEDFLILACDGLWDFLSEDAAAQEVYYMIAENPDDTERVSKHLAQLACYEGSTDNISVIVVFLREPHQIAAEAHRWATRNNPSLNANNMETGLDNSNNPFTNSNGSLKNLDVATDNINVQKSNDELLLNLTDNFKANGADFPKDAFVTEKSNGTEKSTSDVHFDEDFGPETNVDAVDDAFSPVDKSKSFSDDLSKALMDESIPKSFSDEIKDFAEGLINNNPFGDEFSPLPNNENKEIATDNAKEIDFENFQDASRDETPTPPADAVHDAGGLDINPADSDSEDEWNYIKGDQTKPANLSSQPETVEEISEQDDAMSQLNPNAAEFVPTSPTRSIPSPACRALINDEVIAESPKRPGRVDINVPSETEFESEVKSRPSDFDYKNGHDSENENDTVEGEKIENILNGKSLDEIPEFQPGSTPSKLPSEEFHFGPNAAPFTPKALDQSEALSTKANYGDDTEQILNASFNDSELAAQSKEQTDPMSISFYAEKGETNPFQENEDLNKVHELPENLDAFLQESDDFKENVDFNKGVLNVESFSLGTSLDNDQAAIQTTDLDKISQDDEKELASPLDDRDDMLDINSGTNVPSEQPQPITSNSSLLDDFDVVKEKPSSDDSNIASLPELEPINAPSDITATLYSEPMLNPTTFNAEDVLSSPSPAPLESISPSPDDYNLLQQSEAPLPSKTDLVDIDEVPKGDFFGKEEPDQLVDQFSHIEDKLEAKTDFCEVKHETSLPLVDSEESKDNLLETASQENLEVNLIEESEGKLESQSPVCEFRPDTKSPTVNFENPLLCDFKIASAPLQEFEINPKSEVENIESVIKEESVLNDFSTSPVPACEYSADPESCDFAAQDASISESQSPSNLLHEQKQDEEVTSSVKDDVSSPIDLGSPIKSPESLIEEPVNPILHSEINESFETHHQESINPISSAENIEDLPDLQQIESESTQVQSQEISSRNISDLACPFPQSQPLIESRDEPSEINLQEVSNSVDQIQTALSNGLDAFAFSEFNEQISIKTENIAPEFAEPAVITPSEESKAVDEIISSPISSNTEEPIEKLQNIELVASEPKPTEPLIQPQEPEAEALKEAPLLIIPSPIAPLEVKGLKTDGKKSPLPTSGKKPIGKVEPRKSTSSTPKLGAAKPSPKPTTGAPKTGVASRIPPKTGTVKSTTTAKTSSTTTTKPLPKPKSAPIPKSTEKKQLPGSDIKPAPRTALGLAKKPATAPKTAIPPKSTAAAKPKLPLSSKTTTNTTTKTTSTAKPPTRTISSPKTTAAPRTITSTAPRTITSTAPKPRVPLSKTITKSADVEKEKKESANKLTASRSTTVTKTTSGSLSSRTTTTTLKKTETKPLSSRTLVSKTTASSRTTTLSKKPGDIKVASKTKTTKIEKPKQNGVAPTNVTEEITVVNNLVNDSENLLKDNSPLDNKLIETNNALVD